METFVFELNSGIRKHVLCALEDLIPPHIEIVTRCGFFSLIIIAFPWLGIRETLDVVLVPSYQQVFDVYIIGIARLAS